MAYFLSKILKRSKRPKGQERAGMQPWAGVESQVIDINQKRTIPPYGPTGPFIPIEPEPKPTRKKK